MLRELRLRNFAVIDALDVEFEPGLNVLTGETGAGKSVLIDAMLLVRGGRARADVIRTDAESATVQAVIEVGPGSAVRLVLDEAGLPSGDERFLVVRREVSRSGRHRAFVNDTPVSVGLLERLGDHLIEVHGQHEHQRLLEPGHQLELLDRFADAEPQRDGVASLVAKYRTAREAVERLRGADRDRAQREDVLRFQISEIDAARLQAGEEEALRAELGRLKNAERFVATMAEVQGLLADDEAAVVGRLARATRTLEGLARVDPAFQEPAARLAAAGAEVDDAVRTVQRLRAGLVFDPARRDAIEDRLDALQRLRRKYGDSEAGILAFRDRAAAELGTLERHEEVLATEERVLADLLAELESVTAALTARRREGAARLAPRAERALRALGMDHARLEIAVEPLASEPPGVRGGDRVEFRLTTNPGEEPRPLARVASGGELSRTMLALLTVLAGAEPVATMIFDEIDAGLDARLAGVVGEQLVAVAEGRQVICVTHQAAIASRARRHIRVVKSVRRGRTRTAALALQGDERVGEIARMLGGEAAGGPAVDHARALLGRRWL